MTLNVVGVLSSHSPLTREVVLHKVWSLSCRTHAEAISEGRQFPQLAPYQPWERLAACLTPCWGILGLFKEFVR